MSSGDPTRVKSNYIPAYTTIMRQIERCPGVVSSCGGELLMDEIVGADNIAGDISSAARCSYIKYLAFSIKEIHVFSLNIMLSKKLPCLVLTNKSHQDRFMKAISVCIWL